MLCGQVSLAWQQWASPFASFSTVWHIVLWAESRLETGDFLQKFGKPKGKSWVGVTYERHLLVGSQLFCIHYIVTSALGPLGVFAAHAAHQFIASPSLHAEVPTPEIDFELTRLQR